MSETSRVRSRLGLVGGMVIAIAIVVTAVLALSGCVPQAAGQAAAGQAADASADAGPADELRLGYFANVTHAPALVGLEEGLFADALGATKLTTHVFNAGPAAIEALSAGALDAVYIGPNPSINTFIQSGGESARIIAGAATGGAALVVREGIDSADDLEGATLATPQLGNTQDVALRSWLAHEGFETDTTGGGDVRITPTDNAQTLTLFQQGGLDGAWLPEPWVSRLLADGGHGAHVLVDEADLWKDGAFPTTVLLVRAEFLTGHPETVRALLEGHVASVAWFSDHAAEAPDVINAALEAETGTPLADAVITRALEQVRFSVDPHADAFKSLVENGLEAGSRKQGSIDGLFDLRLLNDVLTQTASADGAEPVSAGGLGEE